MSNFWEVAIGVTILVCAGLLLFLIGVQRDTDGLILLAIISFITTYLIQCRRVAISGGDINSGDFKLGLFFNTMMILGFAVVIISLLDIDA